jgi:hypothetical protein
MKDDPLAARRIHRAQQHNGAVHIDIVIAKWVFHASPTALASKWITASGRKISHHSVQGRVVAHVAFDCSHRAVGPCAPCPSTDILELS